MLVQNTNKNYFSTHLGPFSFKQTEFEAIYNLGKSNI